MDDTAYQMARKATSHTPPHAALHNRSSERPPQCRHEYALGRKRSVPLTKVWKFAAHLTLET